MLHFFGFCSFFYKFTKKVGGEGGEKHSEKTEKQTAYGQKGEGDKGMDAESVSEYLRLGYFSYHGNDAVYHYQSEGEARLTKCEGKNAPRQKHRTRAKNGKQVYRGDGESH